MTSLSRRYLEDMKIEKRLKNNKKGYRNVYVYTGDWYSYDLDKKNLQRYKILYAALLVLGIVIYAVCSLQHVYFNFSPIVAVPTIVAIFPMMYELLSIGQFCFFKEKIMRVEFEDTNKKIKLSTCGAAAVLICTVVVAIIISVIGKTITFAGVVVLAGYLFSACCSAAIYLLHKGVKYKKTVNTEQK